MLTRSPVEDIGAPSSPLVPDRGPPWTANDVENVYDSGRHQARRSSAESASRRSGATTVPRWKSGGAHTGTVTPCCQNGYMSSIRSKCAGQSPRDALVDAVDKLAACDFAACDRHGLGGLVRLSLRLRGWLDAVDARIAARAAHLAADGRSDDATTVLADGGRRGRRDAE